MFWGSPAGGGVVGNANVVAGITAVAALVLALRPWRWGRTPAPTVVTVEQVRAATEYLAGETLRYWRKQAKLRRISTPSPRRIAPELTRQHPQVRETLVVDSPCAKMRIHSPGR